MKRLIVFLTIADLGARDDSTIPNHFVTQFDSDVQLVMQQTKSRLEDTVTPHPGIVGSSKAVDRMGEVEPEEMTERHGDTRITEADHQRRYIDLRDYNVALLLDKADEWKILADPTNKYTQGSVAGMNRKKDKVIIAALFGNARNVANALVALPAEQKVLANNEPITMAKLRAAIEIHNANEMDSPEEGGERTFVFNSTVLTNLMAEPQITSADYNTLQALMDFKVDFFMGMKWKRVEFLPKTAAGVRSCAIYGKSYIGFGTGAQVKNRLSERADKNHAKQTYTEMSIGAVRIEDKGVVEIQCQE